MRAIDTRVLGAQGVPFAIQAAKTALAAVLALFLADLGGLPEPYWAAISAIIVMQSDLAELASAALNRLIGTALGAAVGAGVVALLGTDLPAFALAVFLSVLACAVTGHWETYRFAGVTAAIVMLVTHHGPPWLVGLHRFLEVSLGIGVAYALAFAAHRLLPPKNRSSRKRV